MSVYFLLVLLQQASVALSFMKFKNKYKHKWKHLHEAMWPQGYMGTAADIKGRAKWGKVNAQ